MLADDPGCTGAQRPSDRCGPVLLGEEQHRGAGRCQACDILGHVGPVTELDIEEDDVHLDGSLQQLLDGPRVDAHLGLRSFAPARR